MRTKSAAQFFPALVETGQLLGAQPGEHFEQRHALLRQRRNELALRIGDQLQRLLRPPRADHRVDPPPAHLAAQFGFVFQLGQILQRLRGGVAEAQLQICQRQRRLGADPGAFGGVVAKLGEKTFRLRYAPLGGEELARQGAGGDRGEARGELLEQRRRLGGVARTHLGAHQRQRIFLPRRVVAVPLRRLTRLRIKFGGAPVVSGGIRRRRHRALRRRFRRRRDEGSGEEQRRRQKIPHRDQFITPVPLSRRRAVPPRRRREPRRFRRVWP